MKKIGWFDIKTKFKKIIRSIFYAKFGQELICYLVITYIKIVYCTSKKVVIIGDEIVDRLKNNQSIIISCWHHNIMMTPYIIHQIKKINSTRRIAALASKHGDGRFVGKIMEKFGAINISGSTRDGRKSSRGIDMHGLKEIFRVLKNQLGVAFTPDGPRGPAQKINGEIIKIAKLSSSPIVPVGLGYSRFLELKTWDKLKVPLPFGVICYYYGDLFFVDKKTKEEEVKNLNLLLEDKMNLNMFNANKVIKN